MQIRHFVESDRKDVITLWKACDLVKPQNDPNKDIDRKLKVDPELFLVGMEDGELVASVMGGYEGHRGWVNYLAVSPEAQRKGYGKQIMVAVEESIKQKGSPKINLQVRSSNHKVLAFYRAIGYVIEDVVSFGKRLEQDS
ncbi:GNAT family acetyltransferase [Marinomonas sp. 15G1-11]|uniref:GNAT family acetyltransferase n=1 Tax=Marinomonas phaeophyticola TaxID=3004091 RepID=A0ABT4JSV9_9GAMM|nr:GNAT family acetyltransferase [Marinomonas sp. 15G1-11]MCZ2721414.1 GNAT family acetyltransferase [Marinomonas sp. 15G1-11]